MAKALEKIFVCSKCDAQSLKWSGRCLECGGWGTLQELFKDNNTNSNTTTFTSANPVPTISFNAIKSEKTPRFSTNLTELDQVLGGGIVPGSLILIGGEPGIGKSTLLLQICLQLLEEKNSEAVLYCSGEESGQQIKLRLDRLIESHPIKSANLDDLLFLGETNVEKICATVIEKKPRVAIIDSIQTIYSDQSPSEAGSLNQVRICTVKLLETAKANNIAIMIVGHITKEGMVAGPKTLEHMVDTVLYLEGDANHQYRLLKTVKNRFGSTNEVGVFEMTGAGLTQVANPSQIFMDKTQSNIAGNVTSVVIEGSRAFLVQVQALVSKTYFGYPQRRAVGFDANRLQLLIAVLTKRLGLNLSDQDIHINITGGFKINEPAIDLAICAAIISAYKNIAINNSTAIFGEVGLGGEIRVVSQSQKRIKEAEKLGFKKVIMPDCKDNDAKIELVTVKNINDLDLK